MWENGKEIFPTEIPEWHIETANLSRRLPRTSCSQWHS